MEKGHDFQAQLCVYNNTSHIIFGEPLLILDTKFARTFSILRTV